MRKAMARYGIHMAAIVGVIAVGLAVASYILSSQRFYLPGWVPVVGSDFVDYTADFATAKAVVPGQGQTVTISGVIVGEIGDVHLHNGRGRVTMKIRREYTDRLRADATASLRPRTPLQDMIVQLDPGTETAPQLPEGGHIPSSRTDVNVNLDEFINEFDTDTRAYLAALLRDGAKGLKDGGGDDLGGLLRGIEPATVYTSRIAKAMRDHDDQAARAVTSLKKVADALGSNSDALGEFVSGSANTFEAIADSREQLAGVVEKSPEALTKLEEFLDTSGQLGEDLGTASRKLEKPAAKLDRGLRELADFMETSTPVIEDNLRPFARDVQPTLAKINGAVTDLEASADDVALGTGVLREFFDGFAYDPPGEDYSPLTLAGYLSHAAYSLTGIQDAAGAATRTVLLSECSLVTEALTLIRRTDPVARVISDLTGLPQASQPLGNGQSVEAYCATGARR